MPGWIDVSRFARRIEAASDRINARRRRKRPRTGPAGRLGPKLVAGRGLARRRRAFPVGSLIATLLLAAALAVIVLRFGP